MKSVNRNDLIKLIHTLGGSFLRTGRHDIYSINNKTFPVPNSRDISPGVLRDIRKFTGIDFAKILKAG